MVVVVGVVVIIVIVVLIIVVVSGIKQVVFKTCRVTSVQTIVLKNMTVNNDCVIHV